MRTYIRYGHDVGDDLRASQTFEIAEEKQFVFLDRPSKAGAELILTDPMEGSDGAILEARRLFASDPDRYFYPNQYDNPANWRAHYETTAVELLNQTNGRITHFVAGVGTSGTFVGTARRLRHAK